MFRIPSKAPQPIKKFKFFIKILLKLLKFYVIIKILKNIEIEIFIEIFDLLEFH